MKNTKELFQALLNGERLRHKVTENVVYLEDGNLTDIETFDKPEDWEIYDKFYSLKKAHSEGAIIQFQDKDKWITIYNDTINWFDAFNYRIKDDITISQWNKHKDLIKAWWNGAKIQLFDEKNKSWVDRAYPEWFTILKFRIKPLQWKMEIAKWIVDYDGSIYKGSIKKITEVQKFGCKFNTKEQAEKARDQMRTANLLRYWVSTMQDLNEGKSFIYKENKYYYHATDSKREDLGKIYMTLNTAKTICDALNNGELIL